VISSASVWSVKSDGTSQMQILPSSDPEAMMRLLKGFLDGTFSSNSTQRYERKRPCLPVGIKDGGSVTAKERNLVGQLPPLAQRNDGKGTAA
jgi:hypothetical protein